MDALMQELSNIGIVPVVAIDDVRKAVPLAKALVAGGLPAAEVTFRTDAAEAAMRAIAAEVPELLLGAGTVVTKQQVDRAIDAGAKFVVSPGFHPEVTKYALHRGAKIIPGTATPGEMEQAMALGIDVVKFFPAEQNGGVSKLKAIAGPYRDLKWMPTGGIHTKNMMDYLNFNRIVCCGGTWMAKKELLDEEDWEAVTSICNQAVKTMLGIELAHIGIQVEDSATAERTAKMICELLMLEYGRDEKTYYAGSAVQFMRYCEKGQKRHIAFSTNSVERAIYHLSRRGASFLEESRITDENGTKQISLDCEIDGFAIHLCRKNM